MELILACLPVRRAQLNALKAERTDLTRKTKTVEQALESKEARARARARPSRHLPRPF